MPSLREVHEALKEKDSILLAINITTSDKLEDVKAMVKNEGITYPVLLDETGQVSGLYGIRSIPTVVVLNKEGVVVEHHIGAYGEKELLKLLEEN